MLMPDITGIDIIKACRKTKSKSNLKIIVLSTVKDVNLIKNSFDEGANAYLCKDASVAELIDAINTISKDENAIYVGESLKNILVEFQLFEKGKVHLSPREKELLSHVCQGETVKEIADKLDLSINTIQSYMKQLMRKMQVNRTPDLILKAIKQGLFFPNQIH
jgi:two-component system uhpT operon response regulator UhpA